jgi:protoporphyrinogen/coproporphyrinogen III oxidase
MNTKNSQTIECLVVGGGISGLCAAYFLQKKFAQENILAKITLCEKTNSIGGLIQSKKVAGFVCEGSAQGVLDSRENFSFLLKELEEKTLLKIISPQNLNSKSKNRYLWTGSVLLALGPSFKKLFLLWKHKLLKISDLFKIFSEFKTPRPSIFLSSESVFDFFSRHFGSRIALSFVVPLCTGIWGGGARKMLVSLCFPILPKYELLTGSVLKSLWKQRKNLKIKSLGRQEKGIPKGLLSCENGLHDVCMALNKQMLDFGNYELKLFEPITSLQTKPDSVKPNLVCANGKDYDAVIWTSPLWLENNPKNISDHFLPVYAQAEFQNFVVVCVGFEQNAKNVFSTPQGFGALSLENVSDCLGVLYVHSIFPEHVPSKGSALFRILLGGDKHPEILTLSNEEIITNALLCLKNMKHIKNEFSAVDCTVCEVFRWPKAFPLPTEHWHARNTARELYEQSNAGVFFAGLDVSGVAVHQCVESAEIAAKKCFDYLTK